MKYRKKKLMRSLLKLTYKYFCKIYQVIITFLENIFFKRTNSNNLIKNGFFEYQSKTSVNNLILKTKSNRVNKYLSVRNINDKDLKKIISIVFNQKFREFITLKTGFEYSIDFFIAYDREFINFKDRNVSTLDQWYSYKWHFDKPNSSNMLKIIIPLNVDDKGGPLEILDSKESKKINNLNLSEMKILKNSIKFKSNKNTIYAFNPRLCIHKDGIPKQNKISTQVMFQLNPWSNWSVNHKIFNDNNSFNKALDLWTSEPKFTQLIYFHKKRIYSFNNF